MASFNEQDIIKIALPFIRSHYKFRPRGEGEMKVQYNVSTSDGIIADGYIEFTAESGEPFIVTVESVALESREEVVYEREYPLLNWDGLALSSILLAMVYVYANNQSINLTQAYGSIPIVACIIGALLVGVSIFRLLIGWLPRYRYIYSIEQFKQYHATEQWIALGEEVFDDNEVDEHYFEELKVQCIRNGIGLLIVSIKGTVNIIFTPSREAVTSNRKKVIFLPSGSLASAIPNSNTILGKLKTFARKIPFIGESKSALSLSRYRSKNYKQIFLFSGGMLTMLSLFYTEWQDQPIVYLNERRFERAQIKSAKKLKKETKDYYLEEEEIIDSIKDGGYLKVTPTLETTPMPPSSTNVVTTTENGEAIDYSCERFYTFEGKLIAVQDSVFSNLNEANERRYFLRKIGLPMNVVWLGCFKSKNKGYMVYYDLLYDKKELAKQKAQEYQRSLDVYDIPYNRVRLRTIRRLQ